MVWVIILALLAASVIVGLLSRSDRKVTTESFLVSNRSIRFPLGAVTLTATWTQAIALVVGASFAYQGQWNFFWFFAPNILVLVIMGFLAPKIQEVMPRGYTLPQVVGQAFGPGTRTVFFFSAFCSLIYMTVVTMTALQQWLSAQLNMPPWQLSLIIAAFAFAWVIKRGLSSAVMGDAIKVVLVGVGILGVLALQWRYAGAAVRTTLPVAHGSGLWWSIGVPLMITFLSGILCDPDTAERAYAVDRRIVRNAYFTAAAAFAVIVITYGSLGFLARSLGLEISSTRPVALAVLEATTPTWAILATTTAFVILLTAALASLFASAGDLLAIEIYRRFVSPGANDGSTVRWSRAFIVLAVIVGTGIATLNLDLSLLIESMGAIRGNAVVPLLLALFFPRLIKERAVFWGMVVGIVGGIVLTFGDQLWQGVSGSSLPVLAENGRTLGALFALLTPLCTSMAGVRVRARKPVTVQ